MTRATKGAAKRLVIRRLLESPVGRLELDKLLNWTNSPQCVRELRSNFSILTSLDHDQRAVYSLPFSEKQKAYKFLSDSSS